MYVCYVYVSSREGNKGYVVVAYVLTVATAGHMLLLELLSMDSFFFFFIFAYLERFRLH